MEPLQDQGKSRQNLIDLRIRADNKPFQSAIVGSLPNGLFIHKVFVHSEFERHGGRIYFTVRTGKRRGGQLEKFKVRSPAALTRNLSLNDAIEIVGYLYVAGDDWGFHLAYINKIRPGDETAAQRFGRFEVDILALITPMDDDG